MTQFLRGLSLAPVGPLGLPAWATVAPIRHLAIEPFLQRDGGAPSGGGGGDDDDDEETPDLPPATGNAVADTAMREYFNRTRTQMQRVNRRAAGYRRDLRDRETELADLRRESVILSGDDKAAYEAFQALGLKPDEIKAKVAERDDFATKLTGMERTNTIRDVAGIVGFNPTVLADRAGDLTFETRDETQDGKTVKVAYVKAQDGTATPLRQYAEANWGPYLPALVVADGNGATGNGGTPRLSFPSQPAGNGTAPKTPVAAALEAQHEAAAKASSPFAKPAQ